MNSIIRIADKGVDLSTLPRIVQGEENADILTFETDRFYNDIDLSGTTISILFKNKLGTFCDIATRKVINESKLQFSWAISKNATACIGTLTVGIEFNSITSNNVVTVKTVRFPVNIEPGISSEDISGNAPDNWFELINTKVDNLETAIKNKVDKNTVATTTQMGMIQLYSSASGQNRSGLVVDKDTGVAYINARSDRGIYRDGAGQLQINPASEEEVEAGVEQYKPVTPKTLKIVTDDVKTKIITTNKNEIRLSHNEVYWHTGNNDIDGLNIVIGPINFNEKFVSTVIFETGTVLDNIHYPELVYSTEDNFAQIVYTGDDVTVTSVSSTKTIYSFTPKILKRYSMSYCWDGKYLLCVVNGYDIPHSFEMSYDKDFKTMTATEGNREISNWSFINPSGDAGTKSLSFVEGEGIKYSHTTRNKSSYATTSLNSIMAGIITISGVWNTGSSSSAVGNKVYLSFTDDQGNSAFEIQSSYNDTNIYLIVGDNRITAFTNVRGTICTDTDISFNAVYDCTTKTLNSLTLSANDKTYTLNESKTSSCGTISEIRMGSDMSGTDPKIRVTMSCGLKNIDIIATKK